jgi:Restriction endonuclease
VTPTLEALLSLTPAPLRAQIASMMERLGHTLHSDPSAPELVSTKDGRKIVTVCAAPATLAPAGLRDLRRLHQAVTRHNASEGIFISLRGFTPDTDEFAQAMPCIKLVNGERLMEHMRRSMKGVTMPPTYKNVCQQCGCHVTHQTSKGETVTCREGHLVPPSIDATALVRRKFPLSSQPAQMPKPMAQPLTRREIRAHNQKVRARMIRQARQNTSQSLSGQGEPGA